MGHNPIPPARTKTKLDLVVHLYVIGAITFAAFEAQAGDLLERGVADDPAYSPGNYVELAASPWKPAEPTYRLR